MSRIGPRSMVVLLLWVAALYQMPAHSQATVPERIPGIPSSGTPTGRGTKVRQAPCWQVAGVSQSALQQRRTLQQQARTEVRSVCGDNALTAQQKRQQIQQIHQRTRQQVEGLITPAQQEALRACAESRGHHEGGRHATSGHGGPCGEVLSQPAAHGKDADVEEDPEN